MAIQAPYFPIIYVRGFAATMGEIEDATASPYMGFNDGATKIRQRHDRAIVRFIFESPLVRLMKDEKYIDAFRDGAEIDEDARCPSRSVWIFRYYEQASKDLGTGRRQTIPDIAADLRRFILRVRKNVCGGNAADRRKFRVHLVAHSMGGLVVRCYLQNLCVHGSGDPIVDADLGLAPRTAGAPVPDTVHLVDRVFTYATPHNGIDLAGVNTPDLGFLDPFHVRNFNRGEMRSFLTLGDGDTDGSRVDSLNGAFPESRFFSLVGTNYQDYGAFGSLARRATGPMSDGLVMIANAAVRDSPRAFVHRSHSGHYGIVNSEEGYQNLRRFLFGDLRVDAQLVTDALTLPPAVQKEVDKGRDVRASYHIDTSAQVRGATCFLHERRFAHASAILESYDELVKNRKAVFLFTGFLMEKLRTTTAREDPALAFAVGVSIRVPMYEVDGRFFLKNHFEGGPVFEETITFRVLLENKKAPLHYGLASVDGMGVATRPAPLVATADGGAGFEIPLGFDPRDPSPPRPGFRGTMRLTAQRSRSVR